MSNRLNRYSATLTQDETQPASQAMLYGAGLTDEDMQKAQVGVASTGYDGNPCNMHLNGLADAIKEGVKAAGLVGLRFNTIGVSDGISMGTHGMSFSLPSRDVIADSIETIAGAHYYDGLVAVVGCDKNMPGAMIALGRLNRPSLMVYGGTIHGGEHKGEKLNIVSAFEAHGKHIAGTITPEDFRQIIKKACPGPGACGGMYTANTMASAIEAMGMTLPYSSSLPAESGGKRAECGQVGAAMRILLEKDLKPRDIMTYEAFLNAIKLTTVMGGSTNVVLHLLAMAKSVGVKLSLHDFAKVNDELPLLADLKPSGKYLMDDLDKIGGIPAVLRLLLAEKIIEGDCLTVTGKTLRENLAGLPGLPSTQDLVRPFSHPIKETGHIRILFGNLAPAGAVAKITGKEGEFFEGEAITFDSEQALNEGLEAGLIKAGHVVVIRYVGPKGGTGHARNAQTHRGHHGRRPRRQGGPHHRRPLLGRHPRLRGGPHHPRSPGRRGHCPGPQRRPRPHRCRQQYHRRAGARHRTGGPQSHLDRTALQSNLRHSQEIHPQRIVGLRRLRDGRLVILLSHAPFPIHSAHYPPSICK
jgi:dihydroxy-acid dehydratase